MSYLKDLAQNRDERVKDLHLDLPIPTWTISDSDKTPTLIARFGLLKETKKLKKFLNQRRTPEGDSDFIIQTVRELYALDKNRLGSDRRLQNSNLMPDEDAADYSLVEDENGMEVKFDSVLAEQMGVGDISSARECLLYVFKMNEVAITGFCGRLITWMQNTDANVTEGILGE